MEPREAVGPFKETAAYQERYEGLLLDCNAQGTMVVQDRVIERDVDSAPYLFFRRGTREYVFPPQEVSLTEDNSHTIDSSVGYGIRTEEQTFGFDKGLVKGHIRIEYDDANNRAVLKVVDVLGDSEIPSGVMKALEDAFRTQSPSPK